jgi:hypothetical protein
MNQAFLALAVTLAAQVATTVALNAPAVLAPIAASSLGLPAERIGGLLGRLLQRHVYRLNRESSCDADWRSALNPMGQCLRVPLA